MVRLAAKKDFDEIQRVYQSARAYMSRSGNPTQWGGRYPPGELILDDIKNGYLYVLEADGVIFGVFAFIPGDDPSYSHIENGSWKYDKPYCTVHRIASDGTNGGVFDECMRFCKSKADYIRIDTHENNRIMHRKIKEHGFERSGIVYMPDGTPRTAYEYSGGEGK